MKPSTFQDAEDRISESAIGASAATPGTALAQPSRALWVGGAGNLALTFANGSSATLLNVPVGLYPFSVVLVASAGTTATNIVALF